MITKLTEIKGFGIFENYKQGVDAAPFLKFNLVYGWNGSGKTTLSKLFRAVENKLNILPISIKYDKNAGSEMNGPVDLFKWLDLSANIHVHDIVSSENKDFLKLKDEVFKIITSVLIDKVDKVDKVDNAEKV